MKTALTILLIFLTHAQADSKCSNQFVSKKAADARDALYAAFYEEMDGITNQFSPEKKIFFKSVSDGFEVLVDDVFTDAAFYADPQTYSKVLRMYYGNDRNSFQSRYMAHEFVAILVDDGSATYPRNPPQKLSKMIKDAQYKVKDTPQSFSRQIEERYGVVFNRGESLKPGVTLTEARRLIKSKKSEFDPLNPSLFSEELKVKDLTGDAVAAQKGLKKMVGPSQGVSIENFYLPSMGNVPVYRLMAREIGPNVQMGTDELFVELFLGNEMQRIGGGHAFQQHSTGANGTFWFDAKPIDWDRFIPKWKKGNHIEPRSEPFNSTRQPDPWGP